VSEDAGYLARMPVDIVKLDRSLIEAYDEDKALRSVVVHVVEMLLDSGFDVVRKGSRQKFSAMTSSDWAWAICKAGLLGGLSPSHQV